MWNGTAATLKPSATMSMNSPMRKIGCVCAAPAARMADSVVEPTAP